MGSHICILGASRAASARECFLPMGGTSSICQASKSLRVGLGCNGGICRSNSVVRGLLRCSALDPRLVFHFRLHRIWSAEYTSAGMVSSTGTRYCTCNIELVLVDSRGGNLNHPRFGAMGASASLLAQCPGFDSLKYHCVSCVPSDSNVSRLCNGRRERL